jgi:SAM-dependent methyltransferase
MSVTYDLDGQKKVYRIWARFYDKIYVGLLARAQREAVDAAVACGRDILEIGVGTGLTLPYFPADRRVVGIDLSEDMLRVAGQKVAERKLTAVTGLSVMDACRLGLPDEAFNAVTAQQVWQLVFFNAGSEASVPHQDIRTHGEGVLRPCGRRDQRCDNENKLIHKSSEQTIGCVVGLVSHHDLDCHNRQSRDESVGSR